MASAGMSMRAASSNRSSSRAAPSSMENSVCVCRWTKLSPPLELAPLAIGVGSSLLAPPERCSTTRAARRRHRGRRRGSIRGVELTAGQRGPQGRPQISPGARQSPTPQDRGGEPPAHLSATGVSTAAHHVGRRALDSAPMSAPSPYAPLIAGVPVVTTRSLCSAGAPACGSTARTTRGTGSFPPRPARRPPRAGADRRAPRGTCGGGARPARVRRLAAAPTTPRRGRLRRLDAELLAAVAPAGDAVLAGHSVRLDRGHGGAGRGSAAAGAGAGAGQPDRGVGARRPAPGDDGGDRGLPPPRRRPARAPGTALLRHPLMTRIASVAMADHDRPRPAPLDPRRARPLLLHVRRPAHTAGGLPRLGGERRGRVRRRRRRADAARGRRHATTSHPSRRSAPSPRGSRSAARHRARHRPPRALRGTCRGRTGDRGVPRGAAGVVKVLG